MALKHIPVERLVLSSDCGMGREGMARRHALYKMVSLVQGTNIVRKEHGINEAECIAADPNLTLLDVKRTPAAAHRQEDGGEGRQSLRRPLHGVEEEEKQEVACLTARHRPCAVAGSSLLRRRARVRGLDTTDWAGQETPLFLCGAERLDTSDILLDGLCHIP